MRYIVSIIALLAVIYVPATDLRAAPGDETIARFSIEKMTCATCPIAVRKAMERVDGVKSVQVDFESKTATVIFDASVTSALDIGSASTEVGFPATQVAEK